MQEIALSNNLEILTDEILSFGQHINKSYWEIGRRLNYIKENDLVHGQFLNYLEKIKIQRDEAYKLMQIATLPNVATLQHLPKTSLFLLATLPEEEKQALKMYREYTDRKNKNEPFTTTSIKLNSCTRCTNQLKLKCSKDYLHL